MTDGLLNLPIWALVIVTLVLTHITIVTVTVFLHRGQAHRALEMHPALAHFFRFWLWLTTGMVVKEWVAVHRKHHAHSDRDGDPHSPQLFGIRKVLWEGAELYRDAVADRETVERYGHGTPDDWVERHVYSRWNFMGVAVMAVIDLVLFGLPGITIWAVQMFWIPFFAAGVVNGLGHFWGYRNYESADTSTNLSPWGIVIGGEELHNNHHAFPSSAKLSSKPWEFDIGWFYIRLFRGLGLVKVKKLAPKPVVIPGKSTIDIDTVRAVVVNRLHVMADYFNHVMVPVLREEVSAGMSASRRGLRQVRQLLLREASTMDPADRSNLNKLLQDHSTLRTVYEYRDRLQGVWNRAATNHENLMRGLQEWCSQAEATGIKYLQEFARQIRGYALQPG
jgi:stearoyl-CoA desaturase (delta-9 desaturase)